MQGEAEPSLQMTESYRRARSENTHIIRTVNELMELWDIGPMHKHSIYRHWKSEKEITKTIPLTIASKRIKHIATSLTKKENGRDGQNRKRGLRGTYFQF